ncbi:MAG: hypothetical protein M3370_12530, partial [Actinomycetota bacterium]|nr:hypothetical protein [Actinomycetota bacterium]
MEVVDDQQQRCPGGQVEQQPVQAVEYGVLRLARGLDPCGEDDLRARRGSPEQLVPLLLRGRYERRFEELVHDAEAIRPVELAGPRVHDPDPLPLRPCTHRLEQRRLADARRALQERDGSTAAHHIGCHAAQLGELGVPLQESSLHDVRQPKPPDGVREESSDWTSHEATTL